MQLKRKFLKYRSNMTPEAIDAAEAEWNARNEKRKIARDILKFQGLRFMVVWEYFHKDPPKPVRKWLQSSRIALFSWAQARLLLIKSFPLAVLEI